MAYYEAWKSERVEIQGIHPTATILSMKWQVMEMKSQFGLVLVSPPNAGQQNTNKFTKQPKTNLQRK